MDNVSVKFLDLLQHSFAPQPLEQAVIALLEQSELSILGFEKDGSILFASNQCALTLNLTLPKLLSSNVNDLHLEVVTPLSAKTIKSGDTELCWYYILHSEYDNEKFYQELLNSSYDGIYVTDSQGKTLFLNASYERISGIKREVLLNTYMSTLVEKGILSVSLTADVVKEKKAITRIQTNQNNKNVIITGSPIFGKDGQVHRVVTNVRDITELVSLQKQLSFERDRRAALQDTMLKESASENIVGSSPAFQGVLTLAHKVAKMDSSVLVLGETGTGKEVIAQYIHRHSKDNSTPFIKTNCGAIPENLLESEFFGYVAGAFTGANAKGKMGLFELANNGTLFLDEIGELPLSMQSSLLRVLQDGELTRVGDTTPRKVKVRIIAATNRNLQTMIKDGLFRSDLYYRLNVVSIVIPPLRDRRRDIPALAEKMVSNLNAKYGDDKVLTSNFISHLVERQWSGNIRELNNYVERQFVLSDGQLIDTQPEDKNDSIQPRENRELSININGLPTMKEAKDQFEKILLQKAMEEGGSTYKAAELLDMSQPTFYRKYKQHFPDEL